MKPSTGIGNASAVIVRREPFSWYSNTQAIPSKINFSSLRNTGMGRSPGAPNPVSRCHHGTFHLAGRWAGEHCTSVPLKQLSEVAEAGPEQSTLRSRERGGPVGEWSDRCPVGPTIGNGGKKRNRSTLREWESRLPACKASCGGLTSGSAKIVALAVLYMSARRLDTCSPVRPTLVEMNRAPACTSKYLPPRQHINRGPLELRIESDVVVRR
jgi:hypothetical protein